MECRAGGGVHFRGGGGTWNPVVVGAFAGAHDWLPPLLDGLIPASQLYPGTAINRVRALSVSVQTNLQILKPSRRKPQAGDIFAMGLPDGTHIFGRVIDADITERQRAPMPGAYLIYIYRQRSRTKHPHPAELTPDQLLLPPVFINRMPWTKGYFETVEQTELSSHDRLAQHCFWSAAREIHVDENRNPLPREIQPCGDWALSSYRWLDDQVSDALGIARVPEPGA